MGAGSSAKAYRIPHRDCRTGVLRGAGTGEPTLPWAGDTLSMAPGKMSDVSGRTSGICGYMRKGAPIWEVTWRRRSRPRWPS